MESSKILNKKILTPILFLVFNRPEKTKIVFNVIKKVKPLKLYVAADAPRHNVKSDIINCLKVKEIVKDIDWNCEVNYLFHETNQGCSLAGKKAWDWFFSYEEMMIFIEDDGLISESFFGYAQELLEYYKDKKNIAYISGINYGVKQGNCTYFFSRFGGGTYAHATWKRVYDLYDYHLDSYNIDKNKKEFKSNFINTFSYKYFCNKFDNYSIKGGNTYDLQMVYLVHKYNMYNIVPNINLCTNIGFDDEATNYNTMNDNNKIVANMFGNRKRYEITNIIHPKEIFIDKKFENYYYYYRVHPQRSLLKIKIDYYKKYKYFEYLLRILKIILIKLKII